jgi:predicted nucleic acid-binding protein
VRTDAVVVDASISLKWVLQEVHTAEAHALLAEWEEQAVLRLVPSWFGCEIANVLYQRVRRGELTMAEAQLAVRGIMAEAVVRDYEPAIAVRALELAEILGQPATYDAHYLALAEREDCPLWTADERFWRVAGNRFSQIHWLGELPSSSRSSSS